ncbi:hypothetical protein NC651_001151 [Populus alba x Populus x berolinensis]|nr:hypothetical protein NC651_000068 [Populus alba x Populus x berolinensis]KAJ6946311.1 hypothetical protein NC651_001151 [Populus alba x Populus x berolinensis]
MLLNSLHASSMYGNLVTTLMWGKETLVLEETISALLSFNLRKKTGDGNSQGKRLVVRSNHERGRNKFRNKSRNNKTRSKSKKRKDMQCYKCGKTGHMK